MLITKTANKYSSRPTLAGDICMFRGITAAAWKEIFQYLISALFLLVINKT
jgi:hypothetical protein